MNRVCIVLFKLYIKFQIASRVEGSQLLYSSISNVVLEVRYYVCTYAYFVPMYVCMYANGGLYLYFMVSVGHLDSFKAAAFSDYT